LLLHHCLPSDDTLEWIELALNLVEELKVVIHSLCLYLRAFELMKEGELVLFADRFMLLTDFTFLDVPRLELASHFLCPLLLTLL